MARMNHAKSLYICERGLPTCHLFLAAVCAPAPWSSVDVIRVIFRRVVDERRAFLRIAKQSLFGVLDIQPNTLALRKPNNNRT